jgi:hypothetical protein
MNVNLSRRDAWPEYFHGGPHVVRGVLRRDRFWAGFVFGTVRVVWLVPTVGVRVADLTELPLMLNVVFFAAGWINRRTGIPDGPRG